MNCNGILGVVSLRQYGQEIQIIDHFQIARWGLELALYECSLVIV